MTTRTSQELHSNALRTFWRKRRKQTNYDYPPYRGKTLNFFKEGMHDDCRLYGLFFPDRDARDKKTNVIQLRVPVGEWVVRPRSHCPNSACSGSARVDAGDRLSRFARQMPDVPAANLHQISGTRKHSAVFCMPTPGSLVGDAVRPVDCCLTSLLGVLVMSDLAYMLIPNKILLFFLRLV